MTAFKYSVGLLVFLVGINASPQFRGGFISYTITDEDDFQFRVTVTYSSAWQGSPNDCAGSGTPPEGVVEVLFLNPSDTNPNNQVACNPGSGVRVGSGTWSIKDAQFKGTVRPVRYRFPNAWNTFACCQAMTLVPAPNSITLETAIPIGSFNVPNSLNNPPMPQALNVITIQQGTTNSFPISVNDPENDRIACRLATSQAEGGAIFRTQQATAGGANGCNIVIDATSKAPGEYPAAFIIEDFDNSNNVLHSIPYQIVFTVTRGEVTTPTPPPRDFPATVTCEPDSMRVSIPPSSFSGALPDANRVTFTDPTCTATRDVNGNYVLTTTLTTCGTVYVEQTEDHLVYQNSITVRRTTNNNLITREFQVTLTATCRYVRRQSSENDKSFVANGLITAQEENFGNFVLDLQAYDSTFTTPITNFPMSVDLGSRQYCQITVRDSNPDVVVIVERIFASNDPSRLGTPTYDLINNRCPADSTVQLNNIGANKDTFRFSFDAFAFTLDVTQQIYIHCDTFLCHDTSNDARCLQTCPTDVGLNVNNVRRVGGIGRRSLDEQIEGQRISIDEPSKTYFLVVGPYARYSSSDMPVSGGEKTTSFWNESHFIILACTMFLVFVIVIAIFVVQLRSAKQRVQSSPGEGFKQMA